MVSDPAGGIWISTTVQILGLLALLIGLAGVLVGVGKFVEQTTTGITAELKHLNTSMDGMREDFQKLVSLVNSHSERLARIEGRWERNNP